MSVVRIFMVFLFLTLLAFGVQKKIVVDLAKQEAFAYENGELIYSGWVSSGRKRFRTPTGSYTILAKEKLHISDQWPQKKLYKHGKRILQKGGAKMPYMLRLTWSGIALHEGYTPNHPASHGCVRIAKRLAKKLYEWAEMGTLVVIKGKPPRRVKRIHKSFRRYLTKREKLVLHYKRLSFGRLNRLLKKKQNLKNQIVTDSKIAQGKKIAKLKDIMRDVLIIKEAKEAKKKQIALKRQAAKKLKVAKATKVRKTHKKRKRHKRRYSLRKSRFLDAKANIHLPKRGAIELQMPSASYALKM